MLTAEHLKPSKLNYHFDRRQFVNLSEKILVFSNVRREAALKSRRMDSSSGYFFQSTEAGQNEASVSFLLSVVNIL